MSITSLHGAGPTVRLLVIDDDPLERMLIEGFLYRISAFETEMTFCRSVEDAVEAIERGPHAFDLVLTDSKVPPYMDYREFIPSLRSAGHEGPIVVMSASTEDRRFDDHRSHGVSAVVDKLNLGSGGLEALILKHCLMALSPVEAARAAQ